MASLGELFQNPEDLARSAGQASLPTPYSQPDAIPTAQAMPTAKPNSQELDAYAALKAEQESALGQHREYAARMENVQNQLKVRESDLDLVGRINAMLDPSMDKGVRGFLYKEMARNLNIDPKGGTPKEVGAMLMGLDPQTAGSVRGLIGQLSKNTDPGTVRDLMSGIMTGKVPMHEVAAMARQGAIGQAMEAQQGLGEQTAGLFQPPAGGPPPGMMKLGGPKPAEGAGAASGTLLPGEDPWKGVPLDEQPVPAYVNSFLGLDPTKRYTRAELAGMGFDRLPRTEEEFGKFRQKAIESEDGLKKTLSTVGLMKGLMEGRPEVLAQAGVIATTAQGLKDFFAAWKIGGARDDYMVDRATDNVLKMSGLKANAIDAGVLRSLTESLAFSVAQKNNPGRAPTDADYRAAVRQIGSSQSPEVFMGTLKSIVSQQYEGDRTSLQSSAGKRIEMDPARLDKNQIKTLVDSVPITDPAYAQRLKDAYMGVQPAAPAGAAPGGAPAGQQGTPGRGGAVEQREQAVRQAQLEKQQQDAADRAQAKSIAANNDARGAAQLGLAQEAGARAERGEQRADRQEKRSIKEAEERKAEKRQERIQAAFQALAKAMQGGSVPNVMGGGSNLGGDQDANAFKMPTPPQRRAPSPGRARAD